LIVDPDAVIALEFAFQCFKVVPGRLPQIVKPMCGIQYVQFA